MAAGGGGGGGGGENVNSMALLWIIGAIFVVGTILWLSFKNEFLYLFIKIRYIEAVVLYWSVKYLPSGITIFNDLQLFAKNLVDITQALNPNNLSLDYATQLSHYIGLMLRFPLSVIMIYFCYLMYGHNVKMRYKKVYSMDSLSRQEASIWPQINPTLGVNISDLPISDGPWAMSLSPVEFCKKYSLITIQVEMDKNGVARTPSFHLILNKQRASHIFASQLGRLWTAPQNMPIHKRALLAALIARGCRDTKSSRQLLDNINRSCAHGKIEKLNFAGADDLWKKHINNIEIQEIIKVHAYESTLFMDLLLYARADGVLASSDFLWLKPFDRKFWYVLNTVGRQTACCEAAGVHAHFLAERALHRPLGVPMIEEATKALANALAEIKYSPPTAEKLALVKEFESKNTEKAT
jgi:intracellular multiplication protein IcmP